MINPLTFSWRPPYLQDISSNPWKRSSGEVQISLPSWRHHRPLFIPSWCGVLPHDQEIQVGQYFEVITQSHHMMSQEAQGTILLLSPWKSWSSLSLWRTQAAGEPGASVMSTEQILCKTRENHALSVWFLMYVISSGQVRLFKRELATRSGRSPLETAAFLGLYTFLLEIYLLQEPAPLTHLTSTKTPFEGSVSF